MKTIPFRAETPVNSALEAVAALRANPPAEFNDCVITGFEEVPRMFLVKGWRESKQVAFVVVGASATPGEAVRDESVFAFLMGTQPPQT